MQCKIPNDFFLPDGKNTQLSKIVNTWTFNRLTPNGNEGVGVQIDYLEHAYGTRYYVIDKVNGQINAIHDDSLELTEFKGHFSPFDLDDLESKVCRLAIGDKYEEDVFEPHGALQRHYSDSNSRAQNMEESEGMGFNENNYSPIPPVSQITSQQGTTRPTSTLKPMVGTDLNISDPTHNRGKINRINSFTTTQEQTDTAMKQSKGGPVKSSDARDFSQPSTSTQGETHRPQVICTAAEEQITSGKTVMKMFSALDAEPDPMLQKCAMSQQKQSQVTSFVYIVVVLTTSQVGVITNLMTTERNQGQCLGTSGIKNPTKPTIG